MAIHSTERISTTLNGVGIHKGLQASVRFSPNSGHGIRFISATGDAMAAHFSSVRQTERAVTLENKVFGVQTVEHVLSAIAGLDLSDLDILVDGPELPILDGSALPYVGLLKEFAGHSEQDVLKIDRRFEWTYGNKRITMEPSDALHITYHLTVGTEIQSFTYIHSRDHYISEIAPARTFCLASEWGMMRRLGFGRGASAHSGFIMVDDPLALDTIRTEMKLTEPSDTLHTALPFPVVSLEPPRFVNEAVRHKILDMIGDLSLLGSPIIGRIEAFGTGHTENLQAVRQLASAYA